MERTGELMPYEVQKKGDAFVVINSVTKDVKATHEPPDAEEKAKQQVRLLNAVEANPEWAAERSEGNG